MPPAVTPGVRPSISAHSMTIFTTAERRSEDGVSTRILPAEDFQIQIYEKQRNSRYPASGFLHFRLAATAENLLLPPASTITDFRIGHGYDVHALADGLPLVLGGIEIPHTKGFVAHSDGDVAIHAVCDALLGAAALGDIGMHFPDTSDDFKGIDSKILLRRVAALLREKGYEIGNVDCTIRMQRPKLRPHIDAMRTAMAGAMGVGDDRVSVKATTTEHLGFEGREEGVSVSAVALIYKMQAKPGEETVG